VGGVTIDHFVHEQGAVTVFFGAGEAGRLPERIELLEPSRILVVHGGSGAALAATLRATLAARVVGTFDGVVQHVPAESAERALTQAIESHADTVVAIGGGSAIGYAKHIARHTGARVAAVPTTYAGSEMTPIWGVTQDGRKATGRDPGVAPRLVVYDPELTLTLPVSAGSSSGMNAIAHAVDAMYARDASPLVTTMAVQAVELLAHALPAIVRAPRDMTARTEASYGAHLAAMALAATGMALHHRVCHVLGGTYGLPHAETHAVVLPYAVAYNESAAEEASARVAAALGGTRAATSLWELRRLLDLPAGLAELGMRQEDLEAAATDIAGSAGYNPAPVTRDGVLRLLRDAYEGRAPAT
jgi:maleylacetate reductase